MRSQIERCEACRVAVQSEILWECLPVPVFGNPRDPKVKVATVAMNPAKSEFYRAGAPKAERERLPMMKDYTITTDRHNLGFEDVNNARSRRDYYFCDAQSNPRFFYDNWFKPLEEILISLDFGWSYFNGTAVHFDLVACTTKRCWRQVPDMVQKTLQTNCAQFFRQTLSEFPEGTIVLSNGVGPKDIPVDQRIVDAEVPVKSLPPLKVWQGSISCDKNRFAFLGCRLLAKDITPNPDRKAAFVKWLQDQCRRGSSEGVKNTKENGNTRSV